jgi:sirohydrochlorin ferrochelatase
MLGRHRLTISKPQMRTSLSPIAERCTGPADTGLLLVGHGSREPEGVAEFLATARLIAARGGAWAVEPCFLEFARPTIAESVSRLARRGARRIVVAPVILLAAGHIRRDIPRAVAAAAAPFPDIAFEQAEHLGCHEAIVTLSAQRYDEALAGRSRVAVEESALVVVGRGSRDAQARDEMLRFVGERGRLATAGQVRTAFLAMADPPLAPVLEEMARSGAKRIVVQPHLLFSGELLARIRAIVEQCASRHAHAQWLVTNHLGPSELLAKAVVERAAAALAPRAAPR